MNVIDYKQECFLILPKDINNQSINYFGYVYKTTNLINGKIYVGLKRSPIFLPNYLGSGGCNINGKESGLAGAIKKYGKENFKVEVLEWCVDNVSLCRREFYWKNELNVFDSNIGYNIYKGMEGPGLEKQQILRWNNPDKYTNIWKNRTERLKKKFNGSCISEETREKIRNSSKNRKNYRCSEETKQKISKANKGRLAHNKGKPLSKEQKIKLSNYFKGRPNIKRRGIKPTEEQKQNIKNGRKGQRWWSKDNKCKLSRECPGEGWSIGRNNIKGRPAWNKGKHCKNKDN